jgi:hypothetical protein
MLTQAEEDRIYNAMPTEFTVDWQGSTYTYQFPIWWDEEEHEIEYPEVVLGWDMREGIRQEHQSMNQKLNIDTSASQDITEELGHRLYDDLVIQCSVSGDVNDDGVPSKPRAREITGRVSKFFRYEFDQNHEGPNGERPVLAGLVQPPVFAGEDVGGAEADKYQMTVRVAYTERFEKEIPEIEQTDTDTNL